MLTNWNWTRYRRYFRDYWTFPKTTYIFYELLTKLIANYHTFNHVVIYLHILRLSHTYDVFSDISASGKLLLLF